MGKILDRVLETTTTTGTATITLGGASGTYLSFTDGAAFTLNDANGPWLEVNYCIEQRNSSDVVTAWELGLGTLVKPAGASAYLTRDTVRSSSAGGAKVNFGSGTKMVFSPPMAEDFAGNFQLGILRGIPTSGKITDTTITGYDLRASGITETGFTMGRGLLLPATTQQDDVTSVQWNITSDTNADFYFPTAASGTVNVNWFWGFPKVHHLILDFGSETAGAGKIMTASLGVTLNNYQRSKIFGNFLGGPNILGDARIDNLASLTLSSDTQARILCDLNDAGTVKLCASVVEF